MSSSEWRSVQLSDVAAFGSGTTPARARQSEFYDQGTVPWVKTLDLNNGAIVSTDESVTTLAIDQTNLRVHPAGSVLVAMYGGFVQIGRTGVLRIRATTNQAITVVLPDRKLLDSDFLLHLLNYRVGHWRSVASSSRKDPNITKNDVKSFPFHLPSLPEQAVIANVINDATEFLSALEQVIVKKRAIKQGLMRELLTGRTRLPGFTAEWAERKIGEFTEVMTGGTPSTFVSRYWGGDIRWMNSGEIHKKRVREVSGRITVDGLRESPAKILPRGTVLMALVGQGRTRGTVAVTEVELTINQSMAGILPGREHDSDFLYYLLDTRYEELRGESAGDGGRGVLNLKIIKNLSVRMPQLNEQVAIGQVLRDTDAEIETLDRRLEATRAIKQGMMQELLTGRTRLVAEGAA
ncbi:restriction endonuclease subunit S [Actinomadura graeca]|uniref:Restriction endonuclease subunit S n=1 Tax=Actinomadura graeca TaxID=2750812 RepID=A0ABX8R0I8_9ACTN|nr:restriction endonuclease subunit S [Actinomadura graeca]QXJ22538.1 restriction endonuclease subunit S [Actinomadura graeca]